MTFDVLIVLVILVIVNLLAILSLWRSAARRPQKPNKKFLAALLHSKPIVPKHRPPPVIGEGFEPLVTAEERHFFRDFDAFGDVVNWWFGTYYLKANWRLQELPETELKQQILDTPDFGRRYDVFHNQVRVGSLESVPRPRLQPHKARGAHEDPARECPSAARPSHPRLP